MGENASGLGAWWKYLKWRFWDSWHGTSVSAFDERRTSQNEAPGLNLGFFQISWARLGQLLIGLLAGGLFGALIFGLSNLIDWRHLPSGLLDALINVLFLLVPGVLLFLAGFIAGWQFKSATGGGGKNGSN